MYLAVPALVTDKGSPSYSRRPGIAWAQLSVSTATQGTDSCPQSRAGVASRQAWDWAKDYSTEWGKQVGNLSAGWLTAAKHVCLGDGLTLQR